MNHTFKTLATQIVAEASTLNGKVFKKLKISCINQRNLLKLKQIWPLLKSSESMKASDGK